MNGFRCRGCGLRAAGRYFGAVCYWAASRAAQNAHLWLVAKVVSCIGDGGIRDWELPSSALNCRHVGRPEPLGVSDLAKLVQYCCMLLESWSCCALSGGRGTVIGKLKRY